MTCHSIQDLAVFTGGRLRLGVLPPLGGVLEPIRRIQPDLEQLETGDIYWQTSRSPIDVHSAYARGALGIVHEGVRIEPWAGRFALHVRSAEHALELAAIRARKQYRGCLIALLGWAPAGACRRMAREFVRCLSQSTPLKCHCEPACDADMACGMIHLDAECPYSVFNLYRQSQQAQQRNATRFRADVVVTSRQAAAGFPQGSARVICGDDYSSLAELAQAVLEPGQTSKQSEPSVALPSMQDLRESSMPTLLGRSDKLADRWLLGQSPWRVLPGRA